MAPTAKSPNGQTATVAESKPSPSVRPVTVPDFMSARSKGVRLTMLTAYDYTLAKLLDAAGVDGLLVGFKVQRDEARLLEDALAVERAGAFAVVLECLPAEMAQRITAAVKIPTIGIGAGAGCDGQILVTHDMLGLYEDVRPRFVKR